MSFECRMMLKNKLQIIERLEKDLNERNEEFEGKKFEFKKLFSED